MEAASGGGRGPVVRQRPGAYTSVYVEKAMGMAYTPRGGAGKDRQRRRRDRVPYRVMLSHLA